MNSPDTQQWKEDGQAWQAWRTKDEKVLQTDSGPTGCKAVAGLKHGSYYLPNTTPRANEGGNVENT